jgi:DNA-nicking Smr family endonuclease
MVSGREEPESRIDLHGMTLDRAKPSLTQFVLNAHTRGFRLVLVITGKGRARTDQDIMPTPHGILRHHVPMWLNQAPLGHAVLQVRPAHQSHGGSGAYYVYLRRRR